jgi:hypothetical protein
MVEKASVIAHVTIRIFMLLFFIYYSSSLFGSGEQNFSLPGLLFSWKRATDVPSKAIE